MLHPRLRGQGLAQQIIAQLLSNAQLGVIALVAVNGAERFWRSLGFKVRTIATPAGYGDAAPYMERADGGANEATASTA